VARKREKTFSAEREEAQLKQAHDLVSASVKKVESAVRKLGLATSLKPDFLKKTAEYFKRRVAVPKKRYQR